MDESFLLPDPVNDPPQPSQIEDSSPQTKDNTAGGALTASTLQLLTANTPEQRAAAAKELGDSRNQSAVNYLVAALYDPSPEVSRSAVEALEKIGDVASSGLSGVSLEGNEQSSTPSLNEHQSESSENGLDSCAEKAASMGDNRTLGMESMTAPDREHEIKAELEALRRAQMEQLKRVGKVEEQWAPPAQEDQFMAQATQANVPLQSEPGDLEDRKVQQQRRLEEASLLVSNQQQVLRDLEEKLRLNHETEQQLAAEIERLRDAEVQHFKNPETEQVVVDRETELQETITQLEERAQKSKLRVTELENRRRSIDLECEQLSDRIQELKQTEFEQLEALADAESRLAAQERSLSSIRAKLSEYAGREQQLTAEIESLTKTLAEQLERIAQVEEEIRLLQSQSREAARQEALLREEAEKLRQEEALARRKVAEDLRRQTEEELKQHACEREEQLAELQALRSDAEAMANQRAIAEQQLNLQIEELKEKGAQQQQLISEAEARKVAHEEEIRAHTLELDRHASEQEQRCAHFDSVCMQAEAAAKERSEYLNALNQRIEELKQLEAQQAESIAAADSRITLAETELQETENRIRAGQERELSLEQELDQLKQKELSVTERIRATEQAIRDAEAAACEAEQRVAQLRAECEAIQFRGSEASQRSAGQLQRQAELRQEAEQYEHQLAELEVQCRQAGEKIHRNTEAIAQLNAELENLHQQDLNQLQLLRDNEAELRSFIEKRELTTAELGRVEQEKQNELASLEALKNRFASESQHHAEVEEQLQVDLRILRESEEDRLQKIELARAQLQEAEAKAQQQSEEEARLRAEAETQRSAELAARESFAEEMRLQVERETWQREHEEQRQLAELEQLRIEAERVSRERAEEVQTVSNDIDKLRTAEAEYVSRLSEIEERRRAHEEALRQTEAELAQKEEEERQRLAELEVARQEAEARSRQLTDTHKNLLMEIELLDKSKAEGLIKIAQAEEAVRRAQTEANMLNEEESRLRAETLSLQEDARKRLEAAEELKRQIEEGQRKQTEEEQQYLGLLTVRDVALEASRKRAEEHQTILNEIERLRCAELEEQRLLKESEARRLAEEQEFLKLVVERQQQDADQQTRLTTLDEQRAVRQQELQKLGERENQLLAEIENLKVAEASQIERLMGIERHIHEMENIARQAAHDEARLRAEVATQQMPEPVDASLPQTESPDESESHHLAVALNRINELELEIRNQLERQQNMESEIQALREIEQLRRKELAEAHAQLAIGRAGAEEHDVLGTLPEVGLPDAIAEADDPLNLHNYDSASGITSDPQPQGQTVAVASAAPEVTKEGSPSSGEQAGKEESIAIDDMESSIPTSTLNLLRSEDPTTRAAGLFELADFAGESAFNLISKAFDDPTSDVRHAAAHALSKVARDRAASFTRALREASEERRQRIGAALAGSGIANDAIDNLVGESRERTYDAFSTLFLMAKAGEIQPLLHAIETHPDDSVRLAVVSLLTFSNQPDTLPAFRRLAVRGALPSEVRSALMEAIHQISSQRREGVQSAA